MPAIEVSGVGPLKGEIKIQGSKNSVLPVMAAAILHKGMTVIENVPRIQDVFCMLGILEHIGCRCSLDGHVLIIDASDVTTSRIPDDYGKNMRSSIIVAGPLLARTGEAYSGFPGGCSIGKRPIDLHLKAFRELGADVSEDEDGWSFVSRGLSGTDITLDFPSVGATENIVMAAVLARGTTVIRGAAREPEIEELCLFLQTMGADITGTGSSRLVVKGGRPLHDPVFRITGDRIVAGTYITAVMAAGGSVRLQEVNPHHLKAVLETAGRMGLTYAAGEKEIAVSMKERPKSLDLVTGPYPGFPTDLQSPMMAVMACADGTSLLEETIFEGRFGTAKQLRKMGADIIIEGNRAMIRGKHPLRGALVTAGDLRGGAALVTAALGADGVTVITERSHIDRGYEDICRDLKSLGAKIRGLA